MKRLRAFFGGLKQSTSEAYFAWGALAMKALTLALPPVAVGLDTVAGWVGFPSGAMLIAAMITYAVGRMTSKAAKAGNTTP